MDNVKTYTLMIVGSDARFIYLMRYYAQSTGHSVVVAPIDGDVVILAAKERAATIILDPDLVESASLDLLQALKSNPTTCAIPVLVCSWQDEAASLLAQDADQYLQKPVSYEAFLTALKEMVCVSV